MIKPPHTPTRAPRAIYDELVQATWARVQGARETASGPGLIASCEAYLDPCADPAFFRITADGPAVTGWHDPITQTSRVIEASLTAARDPGQITDVPIKPLARMLVAALKEAGATIATSSDPPVARAQASESARHLIADLLNRNARLP